MDILREGFDRFYGLIKPIVFEATKNNPKLAHKLFVESLASIRRLGMSELILSNSANSISPSYVISNAAGFVKDAEIDPRDMKLLGFDRVEYGTLTGDYWPGNDIRVDPRKMWFGLGGTIFKILAEFQRGQKSSKKAIWRFVKTNSLVNCEGLPGLGADEVASVLYGYGDHGVPLSINLMATPGKSGKDALEDIGYTVSKTKDIPYVDRFVLNISCPNTHGACGALDARAENLSRLEGMIDVVRSNMGLLQDLYCKVSPDSTEGDVDDIVAVGEKYHVDGYVISNTTTGHDTKYIDVSPGKGGASGDAVWEASVRTQKYFADRTNKELTACGGINSVERARYRCGIGNCNEIQTFAPVILKGPGLLRDLRRG